MQCLHFSGRLCYSARISEPSGSFSLGSQLRQPYAAPAERPGPLADWGIQRLLVTRSGASLGPCQQQAFELPDRIWFGDAVNQGNFSGQAIKG
jgi:hypothetical protein